MKNIENEVKLEIKHHVSLKKKVKAIQNYSMNKATLQELVEELGVEVQTILNWIANRFPVRLNVTFILEFLPAFLEKQEA